MSTRSVIAVKLPNGKYQGVYCHDDGYPSGVGSVLLKHYNSFERAKALTDLGHLSALYPSTDAPTGHNFDQRVSGYTVAYHRDRGDELDIATGRTFNAVRKKIDHNWAYVFEDGQWFVTNPYRKGLVHIPISAFIVDGDVTDNAINL